MTKEKEKLLEILKGSLDVSEEHVFDELLEDYKNAAFRVTGKFFNNPKVIADLVKQGWRKM